MIILLLLLFTVLDYIIYILFRHTFKISIFRVSWWNSSIVVIWLREWYLIQLFSLFLYLLSAFIYIINAIIVVIDTIFMTRNISIVIVVLQKYVSSVIFCLYFEPFQLLPYLITFSETIICAVIIRVNSTFNLVSSW